MSDNSSIPWAAPSFWGNEEAYLLQAFRSSWISGGAFVERLEREFADYCGSRHAVSASNGTAAIHLAYLALGLGSDDEIIVPGYGFMAAANMALHIGATPVFADVDPLTWCIDAGCIEPLISKRTKAIVAVHTYGCACPMDEIIELANHNNIPVIEDAAEAIGTRLHGKPVGAMGAVGTFSFQATKTITTGEGGMVVTDDADLFARMTLYRNHGMNKVRYFHELAGHNFRLTNIQAAIGCAQLEHINAICDARSAVYQRYFAQLSKQQGVLLQMQSPQSQPVVWSVSVCLDARQYPQGRDRVIEQMQAAGIECRPGFYPPTDMKHLYGAVQVPQSDYISRNVICLPSGPQLKARDIARISTTLLGLRT